MLEDFSSLEEKKESHVLDDEKKGRRKVEGRAFFSFGISPSVGNGEKKEERKFTCGSLKTIMTISKIFQHFC
ncbi:hypothetical protein OPV22_021186 [Ensete ventricosum]|uniref:Uncharacterized protein n=1 Tax=Ensete ventricosum TaxID=4639 RepID=A0AAV8QRE9_ENSVE|nr:hypothetical protein OPV22_021186 [Ensete ventricosum]